MQTRAKFISSVAALAAGTAAPALAVDSFQRIEAHVGGRLGVAAIDTRTGRVLNHRAHERFPLASTFKLPLVMDVLAHVDAGRQRLNRRVSYGRRDLLPYAPVTTAHVSQGHLPLATLCAAAISQSDNTAANLLLQLVGGPADVTRFAHAHGALEFRLDHNEPAVNNDDPREPRDRTSPAAMASLVLALSRGTALSAGSTALLLGWMRATTTGDARLRAGVPAGWRIGDKTGSSAHASNDVGLAWPRHKPPIVVAVYCDAPAATADARDTAIASCGRVVAELLG